MATLREYFIKDGSTNLIQYRVWPIHDVNGSVHGEVAARLHCDFEANAKFVSFYISKMPEIAHPEAVVLQELPTILAWAGSTELLPVLRTRS